MSADSGEGKQMSADSGEGKALHSVGESGKTCGVRVEEGKYLHFVGESGERKYLNSVGRECRCRRRAGVWTGRTAPVTRRSLGVCTAAVPGALKTQRLKMGHPVGASLISEKVQ